MYVHLYSVHSLEIKMLWNQKRSREGHDPDYDDDGDEDDDNNDDDLWRLSLFDTF